MSNSASDKRKVEVGNMNRYNDMTMNIGLIFSFVRPQTLPTLCNRVAINKKPVTAIEFSENSNFLKRSIHDLNFSTESIIRKNFLQTPDNNLFIQILSKLYLL